MKGILPHSCKIVGYLLLALTVFTPMLMYMFGMIDDHNLLYIKHIIKLSVWICLFMIFMARLKDEDTTLCQIRGKALQYAFKAWGMCYILLSLKDLFTGSPLSIDSSAATIFMIICVICLEFLVKKHRIEQQFKHKK